MKENTRNFIYSSTVNWEYNNPIYRNGEDYLQLRLMGEGVWVAWILRSKISHKKILCLLINDLIWYQIQNDAMTELICHCFNST